MTETQQSRPSTDTVPNHSLLLLLGLPFALEVLTVYVLIAVETPLTPVVARLLEKPLGLLVLACVGLIVVCVVMPVVLTIKERRHRSDQSRPGRANHPNG